MKRYSITVIPNGESVSQWHSSVDGSSAQDALERHLSGGMGGDHVKFAREGKCIALVGQQADYGSMLTHGIEIFEVGPPKSTFEIERKVAG